MQLYNKMKSTLTFVLFQLFTIGVFVDGNEESVSVTEGGSVTLKSGVTEIQTDDGIEWRFNGTRIAKISSDSSEIWVKPDGPFRDRLQLDSQTGDLKISNIRTTDSGKYKLLISSPRGSPEMTFSVKVVPAAAAKPVSVLEGDSVTLHTDPTYIHNVIQWRYGQQKSPVAEINRTAGNFKTYDGPDERFRGRLKLDQTGSLTITNIGTRDSGLYEVEIISTSSRYTTHHTQSFSVTVRESGWSSAAVAGIVVGGVLLVAAGVVIYYRCKKSRARH
uniref:Immunoglobulin domain-containing protein n=1 Tax=Cyprinus carpio TaxID=7962 RepID=A0A8C2JSU7_CYPCA